MEDSKNSKIKGDITELSVLLYITKLGYQVSIPQGDRARYDQIWDINGKLLRVQVKTARVHKDGSIEVNCHSTNRFEGKTRNKRYTADEIDGIATIFNDRCYFIRVDEIPSRSIKLRWENPLNNNQINIHWIENYLVEKQLGLII